MEESLIIKSNSILLIFALFLFVNCQNKSNNENEKFNQKLDSLTNAVSDLKKQLNQSQEKDSIEKGDSILSKPQVISVIKIPDTIRQESVKKLLQQESQPDNEQLYYYTNSKKVSLKITAWNNGRRKIYLYDPFGNITYEKEDVRLSYSNVSSIKDFHPNGAVAKITVHNNPGASMYWYESIITFGINNEPQWKEDLKHPSDLEDELNNKSYWDEKTKSWKKQEIVKEQPYPGK